MYFNGNNIIHVQSLFTEAKNSFTLELWLKPTAHIRIAQEPFSIVDGISGQHYAIGPGHGQSDDTAGVGISAGYNGVAVYEHSSNYLFPSLVYPTVMTDWVHVAIVYEHKVPSLYINGEFKKKGLPSKKEHVYASGMFGGYHPYGMYCGYMKNIRVWKYARSKQDIQRDMHTNSIQQTEQLLGTWIFTEEKLNSAPDLPYHFTDKTLMQKILFVRTGYEEPYKPLEESIIDSLRSMVAELYITDQKDNIAALINRVHPQLVLVFGGFDLPPIKIRKIRRTGIKMAIWMTDDPYYIDITKSLAAHYDIVFTQDISCIPIYKKMGCQQVYYLPLGADTNVFYKHEVEDMYKTDVLFIGSGFWNRIQFFDEMAEFLAAKNTLISGIWWDRLQKYALLKEKIQLNKWMSPTETAAYYNGAKIVINMHRSHEDKTFNRNTTNIEALSVNPRTFEIAACGAFQLTDIRPDLRTCYIPDYEIATYNSPQQLMKQIQYYLQHEAEREEIAIRSLHRTIHEHTIQKRVAYLLQRI